MALIERWRPETNTFHLVAGEATITLEDVEVLTGLPTTGSPLIVYPDERPVTDICQQWLGVAPPPSAIQGSTVRVSWVKRLFDRLPDGATAEVVTYHARAYMWVLVAGVLLADRNGDHIQVHLLQLIGDPRVASTYSWGSAVLAWLYKVMGMAAFYSAGSMRGTGDIGGFTLLVELWALERFSRITERYIQGGAPPEFDTFPRGIRWLPVIERHQHRVAMHLEDIRYALDLCTDIVVRIRAVIGYTPCKELVTALIERWRPETNTFHLVAGEATITLEDVEVLTGLPTTGSPLIVYPDERPVTDICQQWLGVAPPPSAIQGSTVRVSWVKRLFDRLPDGATAEVVTYHARAYMWVLVAGVLLADRNGDHIQVHLLQLIGDPRVASTYSWGSAVLAWLYKVMGMAAFYSAGSMRGTGDIGGFTLLVELWALERFSRITERYIQGGAPPEVDTFPRGIRWLPVIERHQHRVAMHLEDIRYALDLCTDIVVRWRPETNTFHLVAGEATITLEDVEVLTGLPTTGSPLIVYPDERPVTDICQQWLGVAPPPSAIQGSTVRVSWVKRLFDRLPDGATAEVVTYHARAYMWVLVAGVLLADRNGDHIQVHLLQLIGDPRVASTYSWGSAVLAWLYKVMGMAAFYSAGSMRGTGDIGGFTLLVELWALERFSRITERYIQGGAPPEVDTFPRGIRWLPVIERHQHRVAMHLEDIRYALDLCTDIVVRWRPETNTFHLVAGEATITLEDVEVLTGLPTTGSPLIVYPDERPVTDICQQWLGVAPPPSAIQGSTVRVSWVKRLFDRLPDGATAEVVTYHARAYMWVLVAGVLLADRNGDHIQVHLLQLIGDPRVASTYSWGSAVLAWLYKVMGMAAFYSAGSMRGTSDIGGFTLLVELWALERFSRITERYIQGGAPPEVDTFPRGIRWLPVIERHQHRVAMHLEDIRYALDLCTDIVVRWRPETNTFHLVAGEATITLEDVEVLTGLPTTGSPLIVYPDERPVTDICQQWLGVAPPPSAIQGSTVRVSWVKRLFDRLPDGATAEVVTYHARAYMWVLVAGVLLADRNGDHIQVHLLQLIGDPRVASTYSWGSAVLAWLYKVMGMAAFYSAGSMRGTSDIGGFTLLVELWALERFSRITERYIQGGAPPEVDTFPRGIRWLPVIERHQHRVAMHLEDIRYALDLCTDIVVRWRPETNTFHLVAGEATITLEDVEVLTGLPTTGSPLIVYPDERPVTDICQQWLGVAPPPSAIQGSTVRISWVKRLFDRLPDGATAEVVTYQARAYMWVLVAGVLLADRNGDHIQVHLLQLIGDPRVASTYSWGSAVLAWLYKVMGMAAFYSAGSMRGTGDIGGFTLLVELWALERFSRITERYIQGGAPPEVDTFPRGIRWLPVIERHQHRVAMHLEDIRYALDLCTDIVVRWRPETNTFHLVAGEATITLEDVEVLTGLPTTGSRLIVYPDERPVTDICQQWLGVAPPPSAIQGSTVRVSWVKRLFDRLPDGATAEVVTYHARAYMWVLVAGVLLADRNGDHIQVHLLQLIGDPRVASTYSWGSAVLAWLYKVMGMAAFYSAGSMRGTGDIGGFTLLVELWALERFSRITERYIQGGAPPEVDTFPRGIRWLPVIERHQHRVAMHLKDIRYALDLCTDIVVRWRPETNTFHLVAGEATITLEDVEVLTGLPTTGSPLIVYPDERPVTDICQQWLGVAPPPSAIQGSTVRVSWVKRLFDRLPDGATAEVHLLQLIGDPRVASTYSWGSAVLAWLYKVMGMAAFYSAGSMRGTSDIGGFTLLVELWALERFSRITERYIQGGAPPEVDTFPRGIRWLPVIERHQHQVAMHLEDIRYALDLCTDIVVRWRPETNTFHLVAGEATITLEDVEVLTGLPTTGSPLIVYPDERPVTDICQQWLGVAPPPSAIQGSTVRVSWVKRLFDRLPDGATAEVVTYHARAYMWVLVAGVLLADRNGDHIQVHLLQLIGDPRVASTYSWGSAVLAWLYKVMGMAAFYSAGSMRGTSDIGGFTLLVELWALERFSRITERYIQGGAPPEVDTFPRGIRWLPVIERHQHRVAMHLEDIRYALDLCTDIVVRWRPETNTFHLVAGEATITLEDVEVLTGLPTTGSPLIVYPDERPVTDICQQWLGVAPPPSAIQGSTVRVSWVKRLFDRLPDGATAEVVTYHARAYMWVLVAGVLLADRNGDHIQVHLLQLIGDPRVASTYSWGSAVLAWLYKVMGMAAFYSAGSMRGTGDIGGFTLLVELWALERFSRITERYIQGGAPPEVDTFPRGIRWLPVIERHQHRVAMHLKDIRYALDLCTDIVVRWRPETNTFHLVAGEATITLEDVEVLTGLPTTGSPLIVYPDERPVTDICQQWLGVAPPPSAIQGSTVRVSWVKRLFDRLPDGATAEVHLLQLIGDPRVASTYSWGSAVLAWLYKVMGMAAFYSAGSMRGTSDIGGFTLLVELWALERFSRITERYIQGGAPPEVDTFPRGIRWLPVIERHQHQVAMHLEDIRYALDLCTDIVVRWRPETNTFHLVAGEATITLEDVEVLTGLPTTGSPLIVYPDERPVTDICQQWLGVAPPPSAIQGSTVRVSWVKRLFDRLPDGATAEVVTYHARAYMWVLVAGVLLADRNGDHIQVHLLQLIGDPRVASTYSWGSAVLAWLYKVMGMAAFYSAGSMRGTSDIGGFTLLVELWALERFSRITERYIQGGAPPEVDTFPRGIRWLPVIERHQHRVAMHLEDIRYALDLCTDIVVRWRPETNTFHLVAGEATITLEDVEVLTGLPTTGSPLIVYPDERPVTDICQQWLGVAPPPSAIQGSTVRVSWVKRLFDRLPDGATAEVVTYHARAYMWVLVAGVLLADRNGDHIQVHLLQLIGDPRVASTYSWGSAVLAWLYKVMGMAAFYSAGSMRGTGDIGGFTLLVELWALERFSRITERYIQGGAPPEVDTFPRGIRWLPVIERHQHRVAMHLEDIRYALDLCTDIVWMSYTDRTQDVALDGDVLWWSVTPLLCIDCITWHHPNRCIRQFEFDQRVPQNPEPAGHVTALIERWRPETNTFHLVAGEATITLEDVEVLTGLPTTGSRLIVYPDERPVTDICQQWLGVAPPPSAIQGSTVRVSWVKRLFDRLPDGATAEVVTYHARAYMWVLVAGVLLADRNGDHIQVHLLQLIGDPRVASTYSWGSAVLAWLYKVMGMAAFYSAGSMRGTGDIGGFTLLVELWALERFSRITERYIQGGAPPEVDTFPRGIRWLPVIERHQHRVAMHLEDIRYALDLCTDIVVRWRPETNTFHLVAGEATITLEDVEVLTGLPTTGSPLIVYPDERPVTDICQQWLGVAPPPSAIQGSTVRVSWVKRLFDRLPDGATAEVVTYHARAYMWVLVAGVLLADRNGDHIQVHLLQLIGDPRVASTYSWGSAVLAWLYKVMGMAAFYSAGSMRGTSDIGGFTLLVELWALERFSRITERYIQGGAPPEVDTFPRGIRWLPVIERHQHRVAMHLEDIRYALDLCTDIVVRWRPETNTFHLVAGEATITLEDVEVLTGLPTTGSPLIVYPDERPVTDICQQWLGVAPPPSAIQGSTVRVSWVKRLFDRLPDGATAEVVTYHARAYMWVLVAGVLLADRNGDHIQVHLLQLIGDPRVASTYSWGSAVLAWLYKVMGMAAFYSAGSMRGTSDIGGFTLLVELWALERFSRITERYIQGGAPPEVDTFPRGIRWLPVIERHQHRVAMHLEDIRYALDLCTDIVVRWRPETNTFHLVAGEATITLEDVEVLTGLPTTGSPLIVYPDERPVTDICQQWLGVAPPPSAIQGSTVRVSWVKRLFDRLPDGATAEVVTYHARAYMWVLVAGVLLADRNGDHIQVHLLQLIGDPRVASTYSWGSAVLAWLYKVMGMAAFYSAGSMRGTGDIGGFTLLVELWALERFSRITERYIQGGAPPEVDTFPRGIRWLPVIERHQHRVAMHLEDIRYALDLCTDIVWMSYTDRTQDVALDGDVLWWSVTPLLCIDCITWHHPNRCIRQFEFDQRVPQNPEPAGHVTALIERWRPETNTFHLVAGEATITLEDVEVLTGLPTTGSPLIVYPDERPVTDICQQWLGVAPPPSAIQGSTVRVSWVKRLFDRLPDGATAEVVTYHARAYMWVLVAGVLLADRNGDHIQVHLLQLIGDPRVASTYSWGSAVLAWLYKVMGMAAFYSAGSMRGTGDIGGFTLLVELWALERFSRITERYIQGGAPPEVDTFPRGIRWLPVIERHQHRVAMHLEDIRYALDLCTDIVVRWRPETNTFHLVAGEATITLEDVEVLTGLPTTGSPLIVYPDERPVTDICQQWLGVAPPPSAIQGSTVRVSWVKRLFDRLPDGATAEVVTYHARAYMWVLVAGVLLADRNGDHIQVHLLQLIGDPRVASTYSWGSAVLAWLYKVMGMAAFYSAGSMRGTSDIGGFTLLVELWALERFSRITERYIQGGAPLEVDTFPRGIRWLPVIERHQHRVAMHLEDIRYALDLCTDIVVRWRPETNTFHLVAGEATITLEDVEVLTGLPTTGSPPIVYPDERPVTDICQQWLGVAPPPSAIQGSTVRVSWVKMLFDRLPDGATAEVVTYHARAYMWVLVAGVLLADRNGDHIQVHLLQLIGDPRVASTYSWGSAVLAWLYKVMGMAAFYSAGSMRGTGDIGGFTLLVELWALERFSRITERYIQGGAPPEVDTFPRGIRWLPVIERHQHRVAMHLEDIRYALDLCTDIVVRWRPETNTFHLVAGEATITLEDVEVLTGLPTTGSPLIVYPDERPVTDICQQWLGVAPPPSAIQGSTVRVSWVKRLFDRLPDGATAEVVTYHARAYMWVLVAGVLLADRNGDHIQVHLLQLIGDPRVASTYSWGSAVLAWLYKVMGMAAFYSAGSMRGTGDIGGFTLLVELWALERFSRITERYIQGGAPPEVDTFPRGIRWLPVIERHQHRVAMHLEDIRYALDLCTDIVVRWRPETNTFHLVAGEATITLEDVEVLTGLPTTGSPLIVYPDERPVTNICQQWLGVAPPPSAIQGSTVRVSWVKRLFDRLPDGATAEVVTYHARAYMWVLVPGVLLADRNGDHIQVHLLQLIGDPRVASTYSWGSAVLAWLYKVMGMAAFYSAGSMRGTGDIGGFTLLVELWALERFSRITERYIQGGAPPEVDTFPRGIRWLLVIERHQHRVAMHLEDIRYALDLCTDIVWMPYTDRTQDVALDGDVLWRSVTPLLCIDCITWHHPNRCIRQFEFDQRVPQNPEPAGHVEELLAADFRWRPETNTFHLVAGEATITLEDVEVLTGLPTTGSPLIVYPDERPVTDICQQWLGVAPPPSAIQGSTVRVSWVKRLFDRLPDGATAEVVTYHARAYMWVLVAGVLLADRNGDHIQVHLLQLIGDPRVASTYSWGSAVLAWLYKVMGMAAFYSAGSMRGTGDIGGFTLLVELWALERFSRITERYIQGGAPPEVDTFPRGIRWLPVIEWHQHRVAMHLEDIRYALDLCTDIVWMPYTDRTQDVALDGDVLWRSVTPLLCIDCITWHHPNHCIRQFEFDQRVPQNPEPAGHVEELLAADFRSSVTVW
ncbi:Serine/threonine-protein phosphatase 7 long form homolog [Linum perenne]